jgi:excisionase family DNA binding protein
MTETLSTEEAARVLGISERTARRWAATGKVEAHKVAAANGKQEWIISTRSIQQVPRPDRSDRTPADRNTVPAALYRDLFERYEAATVELGRMTELREQKLLAERSLSTLEEQVRTLTAQIEAANRRRWFRLGRPRAR